MTLKIVDLKINEGGVNRNGTVMKDVNTDMKRNDGGAKANITDVDLPGTAETRPAEL